MSDREANERGVLVCRHVFFETRPILYVTRPDGDLMFLCGEDDDEVDNPSFYSVVGVNHLLDRDPSVSEGLTLDVDEEIERLAPGADWRRSRF